MARETEFSRPQSGLTVAGGQDSGAYTANEWAPVLIAANRSGGMMVTGAAAPPGLPATQLVPNIGVYYATADRLAVTSPGASQISIATGASLVDGRLHTNSTAITATAITNPGANPRIDRVVVRQNYTVADYTSVNAVGLVVDFNTARIAIISGAEAGAPVAPTLTQDEDRVTYWDIPLYQYQIAVGGAITGLTDEREWVDAETKRMWVQAMVGYNSSAVADIPLSPDVTGIAYGGVVVMPSIVANFTYAYATTIVPNDFISNMISTAVGKGSNPAGAAISCDNIGTYAACGEGFQVSDSTGVSAVGVDDDAYYCIKPLTLASPAVGDILELQFIRGSGDAYAGDWNMFGWLIDYLGWGRR